MSSKYDDRSRPIGTPKTVLSSTINPQTRLKILNEAHPFLEAQKKCKEIWHFLQIADYKKSGLLNDSSLKILLEKQSNNFSELLLIQSPEELLSLFDEDEDGFLNETEQLLIFSAIKEKMQNISEKLCKIQEYNLFKEIMKGIRLLEDDINNYQKILRNRNHKKELSIYNEIGEEEISKFKEMWNVKFEELENLHQIKLEKLKETQKEDKRKLEEKIENEVNMLKIKPKILVKSLQVKERLVAVNERYGEAQIIRNELKQLEAKEQARIDALVYKEHEKWKRNLKKKQEEDLAVLMVKFKAAYGELLVKKEQERVVVDKKIRIRINEIQKSHKLAAVEADKLAKNRDELRRTKIKERMVQEYLSDAKSIKRIKNTEFLDSGLAKGTGYSSYGSIGISTISPVKSSLGNITKFRITSDSLKTDVPVNQKNIFFSYAKWPMMSGLGNSRKVKSLVPLSSLYNNKLELI